MRYLKIDNELFKRNRHKLMNKFEKKSVAMLNSSDQVPRNGDQNFNFRQNSDFFYFTGIEQEKSILLLNPDSKISENKEILFILKPDLNLEIWEGHKLTNEEASEISGIKTVKWLDDFEMTMREIVILSENIYLNSNEYAKFTSEIDSRDLRFISDIKKMFPLHNYQRLAPLITKLRLIKEPEEIELMQKACDITNAAFRRVLKFVKPGVKEYEIEAEITYEFIRNGANGHAYQPIIASGKDNCALHYVFNDKVCNDGDLVLMDFGAEYANYLADTTRTIPVNGKFTERQKEVYSSVLKVLKNAEKLIKKGNTINQINKEVNIFIEEELVKLGLADKNEILDQKKKETVRMKYFMHGNSHFMGLDVHDVGYKDTVLEPGMVLSCEPAIYIAEENIGVRLENDILVTENGQINLLANEPIEIEEIEKLMC